MRPLPLLALLLSAPLHAHFLELIPSSPVLGEGNPPTLHLDIAFTHPMAGGPAMAMERPAQFGVLANGQRQDLLAALAPVERQGVQSWQADYRVSAPADHIFFVDPAPYWEAGEGIWIRHFTKVVVDTFEAESGWDELVGFPLEIEPLSRPYGLWAGSNFTGLVRREGKPLPWAKVEVEWRNDGSLKSATGPYATQVVKADANGSFSFTAPRAGWWGFAALAEGTEKVPDPQGKPASVELGGGIWVHFREMR